jgi:cysteine synthase A
MESLNPSGTGKDRAVKYMLEEAQRLPDFKPGVTIVEGTSGSTGIALAFQCLGLQGRMKQITKQREKGINVVIVMSDDQADEKRALLEKLGAKVVITQCCAISNKDHYVNKARKYVDDINRLTVEGSCDNRAIFMDQFENEANFKAHYTSTGPEIWRQMDSFDKCNNKVSSSQDRPKIDSFVMSAGTGGTIAGVSR